MLGLRQRQAFAVAICRGCADELKAESSKATGREISDRLDDVSEHLDGELGYGLITDNVIEAKRLMQRF
ncbi:MAG: hypothetical protein HOB02_08715 [Proteobacteria bacterium]|nr:hypothetical protein [Pseudomonadota bacterium]